MRALRLLLAAIAIAVPAAACAQWQWIDQAGRQVFSDRPPPDDLPPRNILKQPGGQRAHVSAAADGAAAAAPSQPRPSGQDKDLEEKKRRAEEAEAARRKAEDEKAAQARAANCVRARQAKATVDSGMRIAQLNAQGERIVFDDAARAAESHRAQSVIDGDCAR